MKVTLVAGARPNFMKIAPLLRAMHRFNEGRHDLFRPFLVHTGQHYDYEMSRVFFQDLELPEPDIHLAVGSETHAEQTGKIMIEFEKVLFREEPDLVVVVGDVNSTLAAALAAAKLNVPVAHIEAGIRTFDKDMPEEINRLLTDMISDYLFTPSQVADENLKKEGIPGERIFLVGNIMVDSLLQNRERAEQSRILSRFGVTQGDYAVLTLHRPGNVDNKENLDGILKAIDTIAQKIPVVFPAHPRTRGRIKEFNLLNKSVGNSRFLLVEPLGYLDFLKLMMNARFVMTDSGGIETETTFLSIPCLTLLDVTGWEETVSQGTNILVGSQGKGLLKEALKILDGKCKPGSLPELWDGKAAERIVKVLSR